MSVQTETAAGPSSVVAVYSDQASAEEAVRTLHKEAFPISDLSIVGRDFEVTEEPIGFVGAGNVAAWAAWAGGIFGRFAARGTAEAIAHAKSVISTGEPGEVEIYEFVPED